MWPCRTNSCNVAAQLARILEEGEDAEDEGVEPLMSGGLESELPEGRVVCKTVDDDDASALPGMMRHARTSVIMRQVGLLAAACSCYQQMCLQGWLTACCACGSSWSKAAEVYVQLSQRLV